MSQPETMTFACDPQIGTDLNQLVVWLCNNEPRQVMLEASDTGRSMVTATPAVTAG